MTTSGRLAASELNFRPASYFWPLGLETHLLSRVKGAQRKTALKEWIDGGRAEDMPDFIAKSALTEDERIAFGRIHPHFMGGEYLPDIDEKEVEIARITLASTTSDVTSVYARRDKRRIHYRVVDEYGGDTLTGPTTRTSIKPLTLKELVKFFNAAWPLIDVIRGNEFSSVEEALDFFTAQSQFYLQIDQLYRQRIRRAF